MPRAQQVEPAAVRRRWIVMLYLVAAACLAAAPLLMPAGYGWLRHTVSESAAQGLDGAWLARAGMLTFGFAVICTAVTNRWWSRAAQVAHGAFGVLMIVAAAFSARPADPAAAYVQSEDVIHSIAATAMGFAFAIGVVLVGYGRIVTGGRFGRFDGIALVASVAIPLVMLTWDGVSGFAQRIMFAIAIGWYLVETIRRPAARHSEAAMTARSGP